MADDDNGITYTKPTVLLALEAELAADAGEVDDSGRSYAVEGNDLDGYVGVAPEYMTYANDTEKPGVATEGAEAEVEKRIKASYEAGNAVTQPGDEPAVPVGDGGVDTASGDTPKARRASAAKE